jgi:peroxiredoxin
VVCLDQLVQLHEQVKDFERRACQLVAVVPKSTDHVRTMLGLRGLKPGQLGYPVLADPACTVSATYGVAFQVNLWGDSWTNRPATFVIDRDGVLRYAYRAGSGRFSFTGRPMDPIQVVEDRPTVEDLLRILDALPALRR